MKNNVKTTLFMVLVSVGFSLLLASFGLANTFDFDNGNLQGWTMQGIYAYETYPTVYSNPFTLRWDDDTQYPGAAGSDRLGNNKGSASIYTSNFRLPSNFPSNASYWIIDIVSPVVTSDPEWQTMTEVLINIHTNGFHSGDGKVQILLNATRKSDGQEVWLREEISGSGVYHQFVNGWKDINANHFHNLSNYNINNIRLRIFGNPAYSGAMREIHIDNVTPVNNALTPGLSGSVLVGMCGEGGNKIVISYASDITPVPELIIARIDFTGTIVKIDNLTSFCCGYHPEIIEKKAITDQILEVKFSGFYPGLTICIGLDLDRGFTGTPYGIDYVGASVSLTFNGLSGGCTSPIVANFEKTGAYTAEANFSCISSPTVAPIPPSNLLATTVSSSQINLSWQDNSDNEDGFAIERAMKIGNYWTWWYFIHATSADVESYSDNGLNPNTTYAYRVRAFNSIGNSGYSNSARATTKDENPILLTEDFEGTFPGTNWQSGDLDSRNGYDYWDDQSLGQGGRSYQGNWACYCADISDRPGQQYDNYMNAYFQLKNGIDMSACNKVELTFWVWHDTEPGYDYVSLYYSYNNYGLLHTVTSWKWSGKSNGWKKYTFRFNKYGYDKIWFRFVFHSDHSIRNYEGAYIDNITIKGINNAALSKGNGGEPYVELIEGEIPQYTQLEKESAIEDLENNSLPNDFSLKQNYPNPFNPETQISFSLPESEVVELKVFNLQGQLVKTLLSNEMQAGNHTIHWDGTDSAGNGVAGGIYLYFLKAGQYTAHKKMTFLK